MIMNPNKKRSWVHRANRNRSQESDVDRKARISGYLKKYFDLPCIFSGSVYAIEKKTNEYIVADHNAAAPNLNNPEFWQKYDVCLPDIWIASASPRRIIELNGSIHPEHTPLTMSDGDKAKIEKYGRGGFTQENGTLVILDEVEQDLDEDELVPILSKKLKLQPIID